MPKEKYFYIVFLTILKLFFTILKLKRAISPNKTASNMQHVEKGISDKTVKLVYLSMPERPSF